MTETDFPLAPFQKKLKSGGMDSQTCLELGDALLAQRNPAIYPISLACFQKALQLHPENALACLKMGNILKKLNRQDEALAALQQALRLDPGLTRARFRQLEVIFPILYEKEEEIASVRAAYACRLEEICATVDLCNPAAIEQAARAVGIYPFHLGYQALNDRELQRRYGELVCRIQAARYPQWSRALPIPPRKAGEPLRVGIVSGFFHFHATWKTITRGWLQAMDRKRFALYGYYTGHRPDWATDISRQACVCFVGNDFSLESLCRKITADRLHVLLYPEIGMNGLAVRLSALRLAPVQCASWGHSTTSGLPTIDYFLSSALMEPADGENHYTETLVRLPNLGTYYPTPGIDPAAKQRVDLGLRNRAVLYLCLQSLFKYLPQYDEIFPRIAGIVPDCQFVFMTGRMSKPVIDLFRRRLAGAFARQGLCSDRHVVFFPHLDRPSYFSLHRLGDVFLDSIGWSGNNTTMDAIANDLPVVTWPGHLMRGRQSMAMLQMMGVTATIADSADRYVELASRLGTDTRWRKQIREQVATCKYNLYEDRECIKYLEKFLENVTSAPRPHSNS
jgi:protein O-GlcNAc transferase